MSNHTTPASGPKKKRLSKSSLKCSPLHFDELWRRAREGEFENAHALECDEPVGLIHDAHIAAEVEFEGGRASRRTIVLVHAGEKFFYGCFVRQIHRQRI